MTEPSDIQEWAEKLAVAAPPLTSAQIDHIAHLLFGRPHPLAPAPAWRPRAAPPVRMTDGQGGQLVTVGRYSYVWYGGDPLVVGDRGLLPENCVSRLKEGPGPFVGEVTDLGSTYGGEHSEIIRKLASTS